ncbi:MAG TPA: FHA domain-containing protein, partial [Ktedonobacterales bacterium]|nr:FHA domain-containing protein [Ktedonobacterales bacterium]
VGAPKFIIESDNATFDLSGKTEALIGREDPISNIYPDVDLTPHGGEEGGVSRMHAKLYIQGGQYLLEDLNSTNFTFVNRQKLAPKTPTAIKDGDEVRFGRVITKFVTA